MELIIFDCDGTLVDSEVIATEVFTAYWATHGVHLTPTEFKERFIGKGNDHPDSKKVFEQMPSYAIEEGDRLWDEALNGRLQAVPGIDRLVSKIKTKLSVGSNSSLPHIKRSLERTELAQYFGEHIYSAYQVSNPKPAPDLFLHAAEKVGVSPENCLVIEDSLSGITAAQNAGMKVVGFSGASHFIPSLEDRIKQSKPDWICTSTSELEELFVELNLI